MNTYIERKEKARNKAIDYQHNFNEYVHSYSELALYSEYFYKLAKRYGLIKEFRENGII